MKKRDFRAVAPWEAELNAALLPLGFTDYRDSDALSRLEDSEETPLEQFSTALLAVRSREALDYLLGLFARRNRRILFAAANAVSSIGSRRAIRPLLRVLQSSASSLEQRLAAI